MNRMQPPDIQAENVLVFLIARPEVIARMLPLIKNAHPHAAFTFSGREIHRPFIKAAGFSEFSWIPFPAGPLSFMDSRLFKEHISHKTPLIAYIAVPEMDLRKKPVTLALYANILMLGLDMKAKSVCFVSPDGNRWNWESGRVSRLRAAWAYVWLYRPA